MGDDKLTVRPYNGDDHSMLCDWWAAHRSQSPAKEDLEYASGIIVEDDSEPSGACFLFSTGSLGFVEALVIKPGNNISKSRKIAQKLFDEIQHIAKENKVKKLIAFVASKGMVRECSRTGFNQVGPTMAQMVQII